jgi:hypothetical protein
MKNKILFLVAIFALTIVSTSTFAAFNLVPTGSTQFVGNATGGAEIPAVNCPVGTVAIGMEGTEVVAPGPESALGFMNSYATRCGTLTIDPNTAAVKIAYSVTTPTTKSGITNSGPVKSIDCPANSVVAGYSGFQRVLGTTSLVDALRPRCTTISLDKTANKLVTSAFIDADTALTVIPSPAGATATKIENADCTAGSFVNGFSGRVGELFDKFQLGCAKIEQAVLLVDITDGNPSDYKIVVNTEPKTTEIIGGNKVPMILAPGNYNVSVVNKNDGKVYTNFDCKGITSATPYMIKLVADQPSPACSIKPSAAMSGSMSSDWYTPWLWLIGALFPLAAYILFGHRSRE